MRTLRLACALVAVLGSPGLQQYVSARIPIRPLGEIALDLPRSIADANAALDVARTLRLEMDALAKQAPSSTRDAQINFRRVAFDLLFHGTAARFEAQAMVMAGLRMAAMRAELDQVLNNSPAKNVDRKAVDEALLRFVKASTNGLEPLPPASHPEVSLAPIMLPLEQAVALLDSRKPEPSPTAWPARSVLTHISPVTLHDPDATLAAAVWLDAETRQALVVAFARARAAGDTASMQAVNQCTRAIEAGTRLADRPDGWTARAVCQGLRALAEALSSTNATRVADALTSEASCVTFDPAPLRSDLRAVAAELRARAITNGIRVAEELQVIARGPDAGADVAAKALREDAADLQRIAAIPGWIDAIGAARAPSRPAFENVSKAWSAGLRDASRRDGIRNSMDMFAAEFDLFNAGRFERMVRRGDASAINACAGRSSELLQEIDRRRGAWAGAWATGKPNSDAARRMLQASRMAEVLEWSAALQSRDGTERRLNAWGGCAAPPDSWTPHPKAIAARSALALESFLAGQDAAAESDIATVESDLPMMVVVARLTDILDPWLASRDSLGARLATVRDAPASDAYLGSDRALLMQLSRCLTEEARARALRQDETAKELHGMSAVICAEFAGRLDGDIARLTALKHLAAEIAARPTTPLGSSPKRR